MRPVVTCREEKEKEKSVITPKRIGVGSARATTPPSATANYIYIYTSLDIASRGIPAAHSAAGTIAAADVSQRAAAPRTLPHGPRACERNRFLIWFPGWARGISHTSFVARHFPIYLSDEYRRSRKIHRQRHTLCSQGIPRKSTFVFATCFLHVFFFVQVHGIFRLD